MIRKNLIIEEEQNDLLRRVAYLTKRSESKIIRILIERHLENMEFEKNEVAA